MQIQSPYGKAVSDELQKVYGLAGPEAAAEFVTGHVGQQYGLADVVVDTLHVAFGLTARISAQGQCFYLKFASRHMHPSPEQLFPWLDYARHHGVPVPEVIRTLDGHWFATPLCNSDYDVVYLMREIRGAPMHEARLGQLEQYAATMARFHRVGTSYPHPVAGKLEFWNERIKQCNALFQQARASTIVDVAVSDPR